MVKLLTNFFLVFNRDALAKEKRIDIILLAEKGTTHNVTCIFNEIHRNEITRDTVEKFIKKFKGTVSIADASRSEEPKSAKGEDTSTLVISAIYRSPTTRTGRLSEKKTISQNSGTRILQAVIKINKL